MGHKAPSVKLLKAEDLKHCQDMIVNIQTDMERRSMNIDTELDRYV
jgi:hypothetical protein